MKSITLVLFTIALALLQLATNAQPTYATNANGGLVLLPGRVGTVTLTNTPVASTIVLGGGISVTWKNSQFTYFDWVGLYPVGTGNGEFIEREFMIRGEQTVTFTPSAVGTYEMRYVRGNGITQATFGPFTVTAPPPLSVSIERTGKNVGKITWPSRAGRTYILYISSTLKRDWEPMTVTSGTGETVFVPIPISGGTLFFKVLETETEP